MAAQNLSFGSTTIETDRILREAEIDEDGGGEGQAVDGVKKWPKRECGRHRQGELEANRDMDSVEIRLRMEDALRIAMGS